MKGVTVHILRGLLIGMLAIALPSCEGAVDDVVTAPLQDMVTVTLSTADRASAIDVQTRTTLAEDGITIKWSETDRMQLWMESAADKSAISNAEFALWRYDREWNHAYFRGSIPAGTEEAYNYYAASPIPAEQNGTIATYDIPAVQNGEYNSDWNILVADPVMGAAPLTEGYNETVPLKFRSQVHILRIRIPNNDLGEKITRLDLSFTTPVAGRLDVDVANPGSATLRSEGCSDVITLKFDTPKDAGDIVYAVIAPMAMNSTDPVQMMSTGKITESLVQSFAGKSFEAGHITPIAYTPKFGRYLGTIVRFTLPSDKLGKNTLGEDINSFTLTSTNGALFNNGQTSCNFEVNSEGVYEMIFWDADGIDATALSNSTVNIAYDSEHALIPMTLAVPEVPYHAISTYRLPDVPYLFYEDFSTVNDFESYSEYSTFVTGDKDATSFLNGWTGARVGAEGNTSIRLAARRETSARYHSRVDSAPLANIKAGKTANVSVQFNYGMDRKEGGLGTANVGQTCYMGYVTENTAYKGGDETGTFNDSFYIKELGHSYTNIPYTRTFALSGIGPETRLSWRTECDNKAGANNSTCWLYIDNVVVRIVN